MDKWIRDEINFYPVVDDHGWVLPECKDDLIPPYGFEPDTSLTPKDSQKAQEASEGIEAIDSEGSKE